MPTKFTLEVQKFMLEVKLEITRDNLAAAIKDNERLRDEVRSLKIKVKKYTEAKNRNQPNSKIRNNLRTSLQMHDDFLKYRTEGLRITKAREKAAYAAFKKGITRQEVSPNEYKSVRLKEGQLRARFKTLGSYVPLEGDYAEYFEPIDDEDREAGQKLLEELRAEIK